MDDGRASVGRAQRPSYEAVRGEEKWLLLPQNVLTHLVCHWLVGFKLQLQRKHFLSLPGENPWPPKPLPEAASRGLVLSQEESLIYILGGRTVLGVWWGWHDGDKPGASWLWCRAIGPSEEQDTQTPISHSSINLEFSSLFLFFKIS